jgi:hypothetical protein
MKTLIALSVALVSAASIGDDRTAKNPEAAVEKSAQAKFESLDRNNDDALNKLEARADAAIAAQFASLDINADGFISKREYVAKMTQAHSSPPNSQ